MAFTLNFCSFFLTLPFTLIVADFGILKRPDFPFWPFFWVLLLSGVVSGVLCLTSAIVIYFSSPLHYISISTVRSSTFILFQAFRDPVRRILTPEMFLGHTICLASGIMVMLLHIDRIRQRAGVLWTFPGSLWKLLGFCE